MGGDLGRPGAQRLLKSPLCVKQIGMPQSCLPCTNGTLCLLLQLSLYLLLKLQSSLMLRAQFCQLFKTLTAGHRIGEPLAVLNAGLIEWVDTE